MAQIPTTITNEQETSASPNLYAKNDFGPEAFGAGLAKGLDRFADMEWKLHQERAKDNDETAALDAYNRASIEKSRLLYDPDRGLYTRQGDQVGTIAEDFERGNQEIGESASQGLSPEAKKKFDQMWMRSGMPDREGVMKHEFGERQKYRAATGNATIDLAINNAVMDYANPDVISRSKSEILGAVMQTFTGADKKTIADKVLDGYSEMHKGIVMKLAAESPSRAEQYYTSNKDEFNSADHVQLSNFLRGQIFRSKVLQDAERITSTGGPVRKLYETLFQGNPQGRAVMEALTQQESGFRPKIKAYNPGNRRSPASERVAVGLTQVLTGTAREISADLGDGLIKPGMTGKEIEAVLEDPTTNIRYGTHYLQKQLKRFGGDLETALIAYNAGPGNAEKFLREGRSYAALPDRAQTEPYVRNVMGMYRRNIGDRYPRTAQNLDAAGVQSSATDAQLDSFRTHFNPNELGTLSAPVENGAAQLWEAMPELVKQGIQMNAVGGDLSMSAADPFAKQWVQYNASSFGLTYSETEGGISLSSGQGPTDMAAMVQGEEYDLNEWLQEAEKIEDPARRDAVTKEIMRRHSALGKAAKQDENTLKQQAWELVLDGKEVPIELQKQLSPTYMATLNEYTRKISDTGKIETDWALWTNLRLKTDEELKALGDVMQYRTKLGDTEFKTLVDMVREARGNGDPAKKGLTGAVRTRTQIVQDTVDTLFKRDPEKIGKLNQVLDQEVQTFFDTYKKPPNSTELQQMVDRLVIQGNVFVGGTFDRSDTTYMFDVKPGDTIDEPLVSKEDEIPPAMRRSAAANMEALYGRKLTADEMRWVYTAAIAYKRGAYVRTPASLRDAIVMRAGTKEGTDERFGRASIRMLGLK